MFSRADNASKVALTWLVALMTRARFTLLDCQFMTDHLATMGAIEMPQAMYMRALEKARGRPMMTLGEAYQAFAQAGPDRDQPSSVTSPGKRIAQSLTQTS